MSKDKTETVYGISCCHNKHRDLLRGKEAVSTRLQCSDVEASIWLGVREQLGLQLLVDVHT